MPRPFHDGVELDADFLLERVDGVTTLTLKSRGGARGARNETNAHYDIGLRELLRRMGDQRLKITDAQVTSAHALKNFPAPEDRRLTGDLVFDIDVARFDPDDLRRAIGRAMRKAARDPSLTSSGNNNKRVTFWLSGAASEDLRLLEATLVEAPDSVPDSSSADPVRSGGSSAMSEGEDVPFVAAAHGAGFGDAQANSLVEDAALAAVERHYRQIWRYEDVSRDKVGWDVNLIHREGGHALRVEVKGVSGSEPVVLLTANELRAARVVDNWRLVVVTLALTAPNVVEYSAEQALDVLGHEVDDTRAGFLT